jgi:hypothetical protein
MRLISLPRYQILQETGQWCQASESGTKGVPSVSKRMDFVIQDMLHSNKITSLTDSKKKKQTIYVCIIEIEETFKTHPETNAQETSEKRTSGISCLDVRLRKFFFLIVKK